MLINKIIDNIDLAAEIDLRGGAVPSDIHAEFIARRDCAGVDSLPEDMRLALGHHRDNPFMLPVTGDAATAHSDSVIYGQIFILTRFQDFPFYQIRIPGGSRGAAAALRRVRRSGSPDSGFSIQPG